MRTTPTQAFNVAQRYVASPGAGATVLNANPNRLGATFQLVGTGAAQLKFGAGATAGDYDVVIPQGGYYELPFGWVGMVSMASAAAVIATELV